MMPYTIYVLKDPRVDAVRYVGVTGKSLHERLENHLRDIRNKSNSSPRVQWLCRLDNSGLIPVIEEIDRTSEGAEVAGCLEQEWIEHYEEQGCDLLNVRDGGAGLTSGNRHDISPWAFCRIGSVPDGVVADHEGVSAATIQKWRSDLGVISYHARKKLYSSFDREVARVVSIWDDIVREKWRSEANEIPDCSVYESWAERLEKGIESLKGIDIGDDDVLDIIVRYLRSIVVDIREDMRLTGHRAIIELSDRWQEMRVQQQACGDGVTMDDFDMWIGQLVANKRSVNRDIYDYDRVMDLHDRYIARLREERKNYCCPLHTLGDYPSST